MTEKYALGMDFGTESVRVFVVAVLITVITGKEEDRLFIEP